MNAEEKLRLQVEVQKRLLRLEEQIIELKELSKPIAPDCAIGRVSRMDAINNRSINEAALNKKLIQYDGLNAVLENLHRDDFGKCLVCGDTIPMGRIIIVPENRRCIKCSQR